MQWSSVGPAPNQPAFIQAQRGTVPKRDEFQSREELGGVMCFFLVELVAVLK